MAQSEALDAFIGLDLGDRSTAICILNRHGHVDDCFQKHFAQRPRARIALEAGQSAWIRQIGTMSHCGQCGP